MSNEEIFHPLISMQNYIKYFLGFIIFSNFILIFALRFQIRLNQKFNAMFNIKSIKTELNKIKTMLIITAHPDDEIMFLSPTLKTLTKLNIKIKILCLSNGNYDGIGHIRTEEFKAVSKALKMEDNLLLNVPELQDNIKMFWDEKVVGEKIASFLKDNEDIDTIITFDENGVTNHPNHISCYNGLVYYLKENREIVKGKMINVYLFDSFNFIIQYTLVIPFILFYFKEHGYFSWNCMFSYKHMSLYKSQFNIMRRLHVILSCYSYYNSFTKVELK